jgi:hypothetical protein
MTDKMIVEHVIFEALREYPEYYVDRNDVKIGDTITYIANNQLASKKYKVVNSFDENGNVEKSLEEIEITPSNISNDQPMENEPSSMLQFLWYSDAGKGGRKKHKKTQHKRKRKQMSKSKTKSKSKIFKIKKYSRLT